MDAAGDAGNHMKLQENAACESEVLPRRFERYTLLKRIARGGMG